MNTTTQSVSLADESYIRPTVLFCVFAIAVYFISGELKYFSLEQDVLGRFWTTRWWLMGHMAGGMVALLIGPLQFWNAFRQKHLSAHRWLGRTYLMAILIAFFSSTYMAWTSALALHWTWAIALQSLGLAWLLTASMAYRAIRQRRIQSHKQWMIRSYVVTFAFVAFRWIVDLPFVVDLGNFIERAPTVIWISWVVPLLATEIALQWKKP